MLTTGLDGIHVWASIVVIGRTIYGEDSGNAGIVWRQIGRVMTPPDWRLSWPGTGRVKRISWQGQQGLLLLLNRLGLKRFPLAKVWEW